MVLVQYELKLRYRCVCFFFKLICVTQFYIVKSLMLKQVMFKWTGFHTSTYNKTVLEKLRNNQNYTFHIRPGTKRIKRL